MNWTWITIIALIVLALVDVACIYAGYLMGESSQRRRDRSREEAIRKAAYRDGCEWSADFWRKHMNRSRWMELYDGHSDQKDSS
jgi:hypothetical protein